MLMLLCATHQLSSIIGDAGVVVSSVLLSAATLLSSHMSTGNMGTRPAHKKGRKRPKYPRPWQEHPETARTMAETDIHAHHTEAFLSALRRKWATFRRKANMYAKSTTGLQRLLHVYGVVHNFLRVHFTTREVPAVALGLLERRLSGQEIFQIQMA